MIWRQRPPAPLVSIFTALAMAACTVVPTGPGSVTGETLSGRMTVKVDGVDGAAAHSVTAAFELQGDPSIGRLNLSTPLGSVLAQARWAPGRVVLATPQGEQQFSDLDSLTREALGESLPVAALFDWLRGRPWTGATSSAAPGAKSFEQLGWDVDLARFDDSWVVAKRDRAPAVTVRARLDR